MKRIIYVAVGIMVKSRENVFHIVGPKRVRKEVVIDLILKGRFNFWFTTAYYVM